MELPPDYAANLIYTMGWITAHKCQKKQNSIPDIKFNIYMREEKAKYAKMTFLY